MSESVRIKKKAKKGFKWSLIGQFSKTGIRFVSLAVLARQIDPTYFGVFAFVMIFVGLAELFMTFGFTASIVQRERIDDADLSTAFWSNIVFGVLIYVLIYFSAPLIGSINKTDSALTGVALQSLAGVFFLSSIAAIPSSLLVREIDFRAITIRDILAQTAGVTVAVGLALNGETLLALIAQLWVARIFEVISLYSLVKWRPRFVFSLKKLKEHLSFGVQVGGSQFLAYGSRNIDNFLVGSLLGAGLLGVYSRAYQIMMIPLSNIGKVIAKVLFPTVARLQNDLDEVRLIYTLSLQVIGYCVVPVAVFIIIRPDLVVGVLLGDKWMEVVPILKVLGVLCAIQPVAVVGAPIFRGLGRADIPLKLQSFRLPALLIGIYVGISFYGITGAAVAVMIVEVMGASYMVLRARVLLEMSISTQLRSLLPVATASALAGLGLYMTSRFLTLGFYSDLIVAIVTFFLVVATYALLFERPQLAKLRDVVLEFKSKKMGV